MKNDLSNQGLGAFPRGRGGLGEGRALWRSRLPQVMRRVLALVVVAGFVLIACTPKTPEQRYDERMSRLTQKIEKLQEKIREEQQKEIQRRRDAQESLW